MKVRFVGAYPDGALEMQIIDGGSTGGFGNLVGPPFKV